MVLHIIQLPIPTTKVKKSSWYSLLKRLLSVSIRVHGKGTGRNWTVEFVFYGSPLSSSQPEERGFRRPVYFQFDMGSSGMPARTVDSLLNDWVQIVHLYNCVEDLAEYLKMGKYNMSQIMALKSYSYNKLVIGYEPEKGASVTAQWNEQEKEQLEAHFNRHRNLAQIIHLLHETYQPLVSISKLSTLLQLGVHNNRPQIAVQIFTTIPQSPTLIHLSYQGLKTFLCKYVDEADVLRRRSHCEDDDPLSPVTMDSDESAMTFLGSHHRSPHSPAQGRESGLKFHPPVTPPSGSNHAPSSPNTSNMSQSHRALGN